MTELKIFKAEGTKCFEGVYTSPVTKQGVVIAEDSYTAAIKELTDAIVGLFMGQEIDMNGHLSYILRVEEVNAAIRLAKKYQQLIEGKS